MSRKNDSVANASQSPVLRCAIYTRKSTEEGLDQAFNTLDAQRESGEMYIGSQKPEGWVCLPDRYDDGGYTGGNVDRPALKRLMADIESGKVNCVVVYKVDRLSRSLNDFTRLMETFEKFKVTFVSVTQLFNTGNSMGRLMLNVLLSFAQFEREIISERTRDKIAATRRKGKWSGGRPILGYDIDPQGFRLVVNETEAVQVRDIFAMYLDKQSLLETAKAIEERGWANKSWTSRDGKPMGGRRFDKVMVFKLLTNVAYIGKVKHKNDVYPGEHAAIVDQEIWDRVQQLLVRNGRTGGAMVRNKYGALLKGLLHCSACRCAMGHSYSSRKGNSVRYRYYICNQAQKRGWHTCPSKSIPAGEIERMVVEQIRGIGTNHQVLAATLAQAKAANEEAVERIDSDRRAIEKELKHHYEDVQTLVMASRADGMTSGRLAELNQRIQVAEEKVAELRNQATLASRHQIDERKAKQALAAFDPVWETLTPKEQARAVQLLIKRVEFNGATGKVSITFHPDGLCGVTRIKDEEAA